MVTRSRKLSPVTCDSSNKRDKRISLPGIQSEEAAHFHPKDSPPRKHAQTCWLAASLILSGNIDKAPALRLLRCAESCSRRATFSRLFCPVVLLMPPAFSNSSACVLSRRASLAACRLTCFASRPRVLFSRFIHAWRGWRAFQAAGHECLA